MATKSKKPEVIDMVVDPTSESKQPEYLSKQTLENMTNLPVKANKLPVLVTDADLLLANDIDKQLADTIKAIEEDLAEPKKAANKVWKWFTTREAEATKPLIAARKVISGLVVDCLEKRRIAAELVASQLRIAAAEEARILAEQERETRLQVLVNEGKNEEAGELLAEDLVVENTAMIKPVVEKPVGFGMHSVRTWKGEVTDLKKLVDSVSSGELAGHIGTIENPGILMVNQKYLDKLADMQRATMKYPGIKAVEKVGTSR